jgi:hypothetical protein
VAQARDREQLGHALMEAEDQGLEEVQHALKLSPR